MELWNSVVRRANRRVFRASWGWVLSALLCLAVPAVAGAQVMVVAPHPDDDVIIASGVIQRALQRGETVYVVFVTNGDFVGQSTGFFRQGEAVNAQASLGLTNEDRLIFLGYPDGLVFDMRDEFRFGTGAPLVSHNGIAATYGNRGLGRADYHTYRFGSPALYSWTNVVGDMTDILNTLHPTHIVTTTQWDQHLDHEATFFLVQTAVLNAIAASPGYNPTVHKTTVWPGDDSWPLPGDPTTYFTQIPKPPFGNRHGANPLIWGERESLDVPLAMQVSSATNAKELAIASHATQGGLSGYIGRWVHKDEFFWTEQFAGPLLSSPVPNAGSDQQVNEGVLVTLNGSASWDRNGDSVTRLWRQIAGPSVTLSSTTAASPTFTAPTVPADVALVFELVVSDATFSSLPDAVTVYVHSSTPPPTYGPNLAPQASITASSQRLATGQTAAKVADGVADGYPNSPANEWVTANEGAGAWIQMTWPAPVTVAKIVLYDRPNLSDQLFSGTLTFSDGSTLAAGPLTNNGGAVVYTFTPRTITSLRLDVTQVSGSTGNVGLAEFEVFEVGGVNRPPVANAGPNQTVLGSQLVTLNGGGSTDPNSDPLSYAWTQVAGPAVTLANGQTATPTFIAPAAQPSPQLFRFSLVVSDGQYTSEPDTVDIAISGTVNSPPVANAGPNQNVSAGSQVTLNGTASADPDLGAITYQWTQTAGTAVVLSSASVASPTFTLASDRPSEDLVFQLIVHDGLQPSTPDTVVITVVALPNEAGNVAPLATVTASSQRAPTQSAQKAIDLVVSGYPVDASREWATLNQGAGAWIELRWTGAYWVDRVRLHDRPNTSDQVRRGTLLFSDGSTIPVGALNDDSTGVDIVFPSRRVNWVRFTIDEVSPTTGNVGLAEMLVFRQEGTALDQSPVAVAGANQSVAGGTAVQLNGTGSSDPEGSPLTFLWTQTSGPAVTLSNASTAIAMFTAPPAVFGPQIMQFQLTVSDGVSTSTATTSVSVIQLPNATPIANAGPDQTVAGGAAAQLDGSLSSDGDSQPLNYRWTQLAGPPVTLAAGTTARPTFTAPSANHSTILMFELVVDDSFLTSTPDQVLVTVTGQPEPANVAVTAAVTASSERAPDQAAVRVVDNMVSGFPAVRANAEWVTVAQGAGAWIQLDWPSPQSVNRIRLYDRPNSADQVLSGRLLFSDGSTVPVGALPNAGWEALELTFSTRVIQWVRFEIDTVRAGTANVGLAELQVFQATSQPAAAVTDVTVLEGAGTATLTVTLTGGIDQTVTIDYATADGTASASTDYVATSGTLTFPAGTTSRVITVPLVNDTAAEGAETFVVNLSNAVNATIADSQATVTIADDEGLPGILISDVTLTEGNAGTINAVFTVSLSASSTQTVTVDYASGDGSATAPADYAPVSGRLTFAPGSTSMTISVQVVGDTTFEPSETFVVNLTTPANATIVDSQGSGTITDDDAAPSLAIGDVSVNEGNIGTVNAVFTVSLSAISGQTVTVNFNTANGSAVSPGDYTATAAILTFAPGVISQTVTVVVASDSVNEANETLTVNLTAPTHATISDAQGVGTIVNDDAGPSISIADISVAEGNSGSANAVFVVTLSEASGQTVTVNYATATGTAVTADFAATSGALTFLPGVTSQNVTVAVLGDLFDEDDETFTVGLTGAGGGTIADPTGQGTILDNDNVPSLTIGNATVTESNTVAANAVFTVTLSTASGKTVTVGYATADGTATTPLDYTAATGTVTFAPGTTSRTISIAIPVDLLDEAAETFTVGLSAPSNATISTPQAVGTINDNDATPNLVINNVTVSEPDAGSVNAVFTVTLSAASSQTVTVNYTTTDGTATAPTEYTSVNGTLIFAPGITTQTVTVPVAGDLLDEVNENYTVNLAGAVNATIADAAGTGTITDNDATPTLAINNATVAELDGGSVNVVFNVSLSAASGRTVTVNYATVNGTATTPADYTAASGALTFLPGVTVQTVTVAVHGDVLDEADNDTFFVNLSGAASAGIADSQGLGTIADNDAAPTAVISDVSVVEPDTGSVNAVFTVTLSAASGRTVTVRYDVANGTATRPADYTRVAATLSFAAGVTSHTISVPVQGDVLDEADETFMVNLTTPVGVTLLDTQGAGTIVDNDPTPTLAINDVSTVEPDAGTTNAVFTISLSMPSGQSVTVRYATANGSALAGSDYNTRTGTVTFPAGTTTRTVTVPVRGDNATEPTETYNVVLDSQTNATLGDATGVGTIVNDD